MFLRVSTGILLAAFMLPTYAPAADKNDIKELQRDVALLQDMVKQLQAAQDKKFADLTTLTQQAAESAAKANQAIGAIQTALQQSLRTQEEKVVTPVVGLSTRMDNLTTELHSTENSVNDLSAQLTKILQLLDDVKKAIAVIQTPPPPPSVESGSAPTQGGSPNATAPQTGGQASASAPPGPAPGSASAMYQASLNDYQGGSYPLALNEFADYLKYYDNTPLAPNAQYYIGMIHYAQGDFENAAKDFDLVLEKYPETANKNAEAQYYKGMSLLKSNRKTDADTEFRQLILHHPRTILASQACDQIQALGKRCPTAPATPATKKSSKRE